MASLRTLLPLVASSFFSQAWAKHVQFELDLTWQKGSPNGNVREMIFMNDQFPGPELRLDQGDDVEVCTLSKLPGSLRF